MTKEAALLIGARDILIFEHELRPVSLEHLRGGGRATEALPIILSVYPGHGPVVTDGRHRIFVAREQKKEWVRGVMIGYGPRGGVRWVYRGKIPI